MTGDVLLHNTVVWQAQRDAAATSAKEPHGLNFGPIFADQRAAVSAADLWDALDTDWLAYGNDFGGGQSGTVDTLPIQKDGKPDTLPVKLGKYAAVIFSR